MEPQNVPMEPSESPTDPCTDPATSKADPARSEADPAMSDAAPKTSAGLAWSNRPLPRTRRHCAGAVHSCVEDRLMLCDPCGFNFTYHGDVSTRYMYHGVYFGTSQRESTGKRTEIDYVVQERRLYEYVYCLLCEGDIQWNGHKCWHLRPYSPMRPSARHYTLAIGHHLRPIGAIPPARQHSCASSASCC